MVGLVGGARLEGNLPPAIQFVDFFGLGPFGYWPLKPSDPSSNLCSCCFICFSLALRNETVALSVPFFTALACVLLVVGPKVPPLPPSRGFLDSGDGFIGQNEKALKNSGARECVCKAGQAVQNSKTHFFFCVFSKTLVRAIFDFVPLGDSHNDSSEKPTNWLRAGKMPSRPPPPDPAPS